MSSTAAVSTSRSKFAVIANAPRDACAIIRHAELLTSLLAIAGAISTSRPVTGRINQAAFTTTSTVTVSNRDIIDLATRISSAVLGSSIVGLFDVLCCLRLARRQLLSCHNFYRATLC